MYIRFKNKSGFTYTLIYYIRSNYLGSTLFFNLTRIMNDNNDENAINISKVDQLQSNDG